METLQTLSMPSISLIGVLILILTVFLIVPVWTRFEKNRRTQIRKKYAQEKGIPLSSLQPNRSKISHRKKKEVFSRDAHRCVRCGSDQNLTIDHKIPRTAGGGNELENLQLLCLRCNQQKGSSY